MAAILKLYSKSLSNNFTLRYFSRNINKGSQLCTFSRQNTFHNLGNSKSGVLVIKTEISFGDVSQFQKRNFRTSLILCEDKIVNTPPFPESVAEGDIRWEKGVGDAVKIDEVICEIETDKTSIPVPAPGAGVIAERFVEDGATVKAGQKLFRITLGAAGAGATTTSSTKSSVKTADTVSSAAPTKTPSPKPPSPPPPSTPSIISSDTKPPPTTSQLSAIPKLSSTPKTSMPVAAIKHAQAIEAASVRLPPDDPINEISGTRTEYRVKMNRMRQKIAQRLKEAQNTNAMLTTFNEIDMSAIIEFRRLNQDSFTKKHGIKLGFMSPFVKAAAFALQDQPVVNAVIMDNEIVYRDYVDISVAVATPKGLVVPVVRNVESMNYGEIEKAINLLGEKARTGKLAVEDMDGGTFTISNGGVFGSLMGTPIINPPQSAILGMHATFERPVAIKGQVLIRPMMYIALTYDHRLIDGREAVLFLRKIKAAVEDPRIIVAGL